MALSELKAFSEESDTTRRVVLIRQITPSMLNVFNFPDIDSLQREAIWANCFQTLDDSPDDTVVVLDFIRILSRDRTRLDVILDKNQWYIEKLLVLAKLTNPDERISEADAPVVEASLKCLGNIGKQSTVGLNLLASDDTILSLVNRLSGDVQRAIRDFDVRLLFLATALRKSCRHFVRRDCRGLEVLQKLIESVVERGHALGMELGDRPRLGPLDINAKTRCVLDEDDSTLVCDVLKVLYNLTLASEDADEEKDAVDGLIILMRQLLLSSPKDDPMKKRQLVSNIMNLLTTVPPDCFQRVIDIRESGASDRPARPEDDEEAMKPIAVLVALLDLLLSSMQESNVFESLFPTLLGMSRMAKANSCIRRYLRRKVLPWLKKDDIMKKPEEGTKLRNKLVKLLTHPSIELKEAAATFLFVLCKENVGRMVKYTGFGNAAGMLSTRGLLDGRPSEGAAHYSSDSMSDSDTEDYKELASSINPVVGCFEPPRPSATDSMTDEQKEVEAMRLVSLIDRMNRQGCIQPVRIGTDGRLRPVDHVLQLQEGIDPAKFAKNGDAGSSDED